MSRGFAGGDFFTLIRQRPSMPLLYLLWKRLAEWDPSYIQLRMYVCLCACMRRPPSLAPTHRNCAVLGTDSERGRTAVELIKDIPGAQVTRLHNGLLLLLVYVYTHAYCPHQIPGVDNKHHAFWLFPVMVADPPRVCRIMSAQVRCAPASPFHPAVASSSCLPARLCIMMVQGFDVTQGTTQLGPALKYEAVSTRL